MTVGAGSLGTLLRASFLHFHCSGRNSLNSLSSSSRSGRLHFSVSISRIVAPNSSSFWTASLSPRLLESVITANSNCDRPGLAAELDCTEQVFYVIEQADVELFMLIGLLLLVLILLGGQTFEFLSDPCYFALDHLL